MDNSTTPASTPVAILPASNVGSSAFADNSSPSVESPTCRNTAAQNHELFQDHQVSLAQQMIKNTVWCSFCCFLALFIADIVILAMSWSEPCDVDLKYWILINLIVYTSIFIGNFFIYCLLKCNEDIIENRRFIKFTKWEIAIELIVGVGLWIWGWIWLAKSDTCDDTAEDIFNLMLAHLIISTIDIAILALSLCALTYALGFLLGHGMLSNSGLTSENIDTLPMFLFNNDSIVQHGATPEQIEGQQNTVNVDDIKLEDQDKKCCICMDNYANGVNLRVLNCKHHMHKECCDKWLKNSNSCPICRAQVIDWVTLEK